MLRLGTTGRYNIHIHRTACSQHGLRIAANTSLRRHGAGNALKSTGASRTFHVAAYSGSLSRQGVEIESTFDHRDGSNIHNIPASEERSCAEASVSEDSEREFISGLTLSVVAHSSAPLKI